MSGHTPTPWRVQKYAAGASFYLYADSDSDINRTVGRISGINKEANAAYIVRAVNCHSDLIQAVNGLLYYIQHNDIGADARAFALKQADAALAKAREEA